VTARSKQEFTDEQDGKHSALQRCAPAAMHSAPQQRSVCVQPAHRLGLQSLQLLCANVHGASRIGNTDGQLAALRQQPARLAGLTQQHLWRNGWITSERIAFRRNQLYAASCRADGLAASGKQFYVSLTLPSIRNLHASMQGAYVNVSEGPLEI